MLISSLTGCSGRISNSVRAKQVGPRTMHEIRKEKRNPEQLHVLLSRMAEPLVTEAARQFSWHASPDTPALEAGHSSDCPIFRVRTLGARESCLLPDPFGQKLCYWIGAYGTDR